MNPKPNISVATILSISFLLPGLNNLFGQNTKKLELFATTIK